MLVRSREWLLFVLPGKKDVVSAGRLCVRELETVDQIERFSLSETVVEVLMSRRINV